MCGALAALDTGVHIAGSGGDRSVPFTDFHLLPEGHPEIETVLRPGELITAVEIPALSFGARSTYRKVRDRASYAFALVSVAAAIDLDGDTVRDVRLAFGGVAAKPWRALHAEAALRGGPATASAFRAAVDAELVGATPLRHNGFKVELLRRTVPAVLTELSEMHS